jgi:hypothetical protein
MCSALRLAACVERFRNYGALFCAVPIAALDTVCSAALAAGGTDGVTGELALRRHDPVTRRSSNKSADRPGADRRPAMTRTLLAFAERPEERPGN